ncbi:MAG: exo-alpha-sialidase [Cyclobacteriaceae bacterium]
MKFYYFILAAFVILGSCNQVKETPALTVTTLWPGKQPAYNNHRIPSLIVTKSGTLLAFSEGREGGDTGNIDILLKRSSDNGVTWGEQIIVWNDATNSCGNPCPVVDQRTGRISLLMTWNLGSDHESDIIRKQSEQTRVPYISYSDDDGLTWSAPKSLLASSKNSEWGWYATGPGVGIQIENGPYSGRLIIPANHSYDLPENQQMDGFGYGAHVLLSDDGGANWSMSEPIRPAVNESQVVELSDGSLLMNMRSYNQKSSRAVSLSHDGGETWSEIVHDPQLVESVCQGSIIGIGQFERSYLFANPAVPVGRTHMTIKYSKDECKSWPNAKLVYAGPSAYSSLTMLPNGRIGLLFEAGVNNPYEQLVFVSLEVAELFTPGALLNSSSGW